MKWSGLKLSDLRLCAEARGQPDVDVRQVVTRSTWQPRIGRDVVAVALATGGYLVFDRCKATATFRVPIQIAPEELLHPYLVPAAAAFSSWSGREAYHAGAFVLDGKAWALVADREGGKSTMLAALAQRGFPVLSDDLVILDGCTILQGPRLIDLREPSAMRMGLGQPIESARQGGRWRMLLAQTPDVELAGWVFLRWARQIEVHRIGLPDLINRLLQLRPTKAEAVLTLASLPAYEFLRPPSWSLLPAVIDRLLVSIGRTTSRT